MAPSESSSIGGQGDETPAIQQQSVENQEIARLESRFSQLMSMVNDMQRKEPGDAVAGDASWSGGAAAPVSQTLPPGCGGAFSGERETARGPHHPPERRWGSTPEASPGVAA